ncbi:unnamed protein product [Vicia faba]|uniref:Uncharacterized protein n=1 Tax=Vicia faba TaxID=3906 RepID=A0AAV0ZRN2_VICFA|nr:unnamed protein product [Vicia faba]
MGTTKTEVTSPPRFAAIGPFFFEQQQQSSHFRNNRHIFGKIIIFMENFVLMMLNLQLSRIYSSPSILLLNPNGLSKSLKGKSIFITLDPVNEFFFEVAATKFINNEAKVITTDIDEKHGQKNVKELGSNATFITFNVMEESDISDFIDFAVSKYKQLDIMYNNAPTQQNSKHRNCS